MVVFYGQGVGDYSAYLIDLLLYNTDPETIVEPILKDIIIAANARSQSKGMITVVNGVHTSHYMKKGASEYGQFTPFWFDVQGTINNKELIVDGSRKVHLYITKYQIITDIYGNAYYDRMNIPHDKNYTAIPEEGDEYRAINWFFTNRVTGSHEYDDEIMMYGGGIKKRGMKKKTKSKKNKIKSEKIPLKIEPLSKKEIKVQEKETKKLVNVFKKYKKKLNKLFKKV